MQIDSINTALILAAHPDDAEFGCGATIRKLTDNGVRVYYAVFSPCDRSLPEGYEKGALYIELMKAAAHLGVNTEDVHTYVFPVRDFPKFRQDILEILIVLKKELKPDVVLMPNSHDVHQDHHVIYEEGVRAFKTTRMLGYELVWNNIINVTNFQIPISEDQLKAKIAAIDEYKSQSFRNYKDEEFFRGLAKVRGIQTGADLAESFEAIRWIL